MPQSQSSWKWTSLLTPAVFAMITIGGIWATLDGRIRAVETKQAAQEGWKQANDSTLKTLRDEVQFVGREFQKCRAEDQRRWAEIREELAMLRARLEVLLPVGPRTGPSAD